MAALIDTAKKGRKADAHPPWPRPIVTSDAWRLVVQQLVEARATMIGLWGDAGAVHLALIEEPSGEIGVFTLECRDGKFPSVGALHPPAIRLERAMRDLYGLKPAGLFRTPAPPRLGLCGGAHRLGQARKTRGA